MISRRTATGVVMTLLSASVVVAAVRSDGFHATSVTLNDGAVWVYNDSRQIVARINTQTAEAESAVPLPGASAVLQSGTVVYGLVGESSLVRFDPAGGGAVPNEKWPSAGSVAIGASAGVLVDRESGNVWFDSATGIANWTEEREPQAEASPGSVGLASADGRAVVVDPADDTLLLPEVDDAGVLTGVTTVPFGADIPDEIDGAQLAQVGAVTAVLDGQGSLIVSTGADADIRAAGDSPSLQESGAGGDIVVVGDDAIVSVDPDSGEAVVLADAPDGATTAGRPIVHGSCVSATWSSPEPTFVQVCAGGSTEPAPVPGVPGGSRLHFEMNGQALVLSAPGDSHFVVRDGRLIPVTNWDQVDPDKIDEEEEDDPAPTETTDETERQCDEAPSKPTARDVPFEFGANPSNTIIIDAVSLFFDSNCDPLTVTQVTTSLDTEGSAPLAAAINFGQAIQVSAPATEGALTVSFVVTDGTAGNELESQITVNVLSTHDSSPEMRNPDRQPRTAVQQGKSISYNVLLDWTDRDGDVLSLVSAAVNEGDGRVVYGSDGLVTFTAESSTGVKTVNVIVSDGFGHDVPGTLEVVVQPGGTPIAPVARDDYAVGRVGEPITIKPLLNDTDANEDELTKQVLRDGLPDTAIVDNTSVSDAVVFTAADAGTYVLDYVVADTTGLSAEAKIRVDVVAPSDENLPPVAVRDAVIVREGRTANVDVLVNDNDPNGDVIAVESATIKDAAIAAQGLARAVVIDRRYVRVEVFSTPTPATFVVEYLITDGRSDAVPGQLLVSVPAAVGNQYPIVEDDEARVRVGEVVSVAVLANDRDPDGDQLVMVPGSVQLDPGSPGVAWLDGTTVRYKAGAEAPTRPVVIRYEVEDDPSFSGLHRVAGNVLVDVVGEDAKNEPPIPPPLEMRVFTGAVATLRVPVTGIDANGDVVEVRDVLDQPTLGRVTFVNGDFLYEAESTPGPDQFTYSVRDRGGLTGIGTVRVVVIEGTAHSPVPINDRVFTRPGRIVSVNVLSNDTDPDGDQVRLSDEVGFEAPITAEANDGRIDVEIPDSTTAATYIVRYSIFDDRSPDPQQAVITIVADPEAPLLAPITRDDPDEILTPLVRTTATDPSGQVVEVAEVAVTTNDDDPDGTRAGLAAAVVAGQPGVVDATAFLPAAPRGTIRVALTDRTQWVVYSATDPDGNSASAVVRVPPAGNQAPECPRADEPVATANVAEGEIRIDIADVVTDPDNDVVQLEGETPTLQPADGELTFTPQDFTGFGYVPRPDTTVDSVVVRAKVIDRPGAENAETTYCSLLIDIERDNDAPTATDASFQVELETDGDVDLGNLETLGAATDPDGDELTFELLTEAEQNGVTLSVSPRGDLTVNANEAPVGVALEYEYTVTDGLATSGEPKRAKILLNVVNTTKPPPVVQSFERTDVQQGQPVTIDVAEGEFNPFTEPLVYAIDPSPTEGRGTVSASGSQLTFTPAADFFGVAVVGFTATDDVGRIASGTVRYTVIGKPLAPGQPTDSEVSSHRVVLSWAPAEPQGAPILNYRVQWPGGSKDVGTATSATIDGLQNGVAVAFTVVAQNKVGDSPPSAPSRSVMPDQVPPQPNAPRITSFGDKTLTVEWDEVVPDGTPIIRYDIYRSDGAIEQLPASARSFTFTALQNGVPYTFTMIAINDAGPSERSAASNELSPATFPDAPTGLVATDAGVAIEARVQLNWTRPADNGRPITGYKIFDNGQLVTGTGSETSAATSANFRLTPGNHVFTVVAINAVGDSPASAPSPTAVFAKQPDPPVLSAATSDVDRAIPIGYTAPSGAGTGGCPLSAVQYETNGSGTWATVPGDSVIRALSTGGALVNGTTYSIRLRALNCKPSVPSNPSTALNARPSGPPILAGVTVSGSLTSNSVTGTTISWSWNGVGAANGAPPYSYALSGAINGATASSGSQQTGHGHGQSITLTLTVTDALGRQAARSYTVNTPPPPPRVVTTTRGSAFGPCPSNNAVTCYYFTISISGFSPGAHGFVCFDGAVILGQTYSGTINADGNGNGSLSTSNTSPFCVAATFNAAGVQVDGVPDNNGGW